MALLEIVAFDVQSALEAAICGADRIEICDNHTDGGTTPSLGVVALLKEELTIPVFPMVRPRGGDFLYTGDEIKVMLKDLISFKELGCEGVVLGILTRNGEVDYENLCRLVDIAHPMQVTFHRAFDRTKNFEEAVNRIYEAGCSRILTSGGYPTVGESIECLQQLKELAGNKLKIVAGGGVNRNVIAKLLSIGITEIHTPARMMKSSNMDYVNPNMKENLQYSGIDDEELKEIVRLIKKSRK